MSRPLVSVITPTWERRDLLLEAIESVRQQTYRPLEHVIVSDGPDAALTGSMHDRQIEYASDVSIRFVELGRNWSAFLPDAYAAAPLVVAQLVARGEYQAFLADDERMAPDHIAALVALCEIEGADFAYSKTEMYWRDRPAERWLIGQAPPAYGQITNAVYRADLLKHGLYPVGAGMASDWACFSQWLRAGARWAFLDRVTLTHRADN